MNEVNLVFPHQLFENSILLDNNFEFYLVEEYLFFKQYSFHKQKIAFHRASMKFYESYLVKKGKIVHYIDSIDSISDIRKLIKYFAKKGIGKINCIDPTDNWLEKRIIKTSEEFGIEYQFYENPLFLNKRNENNNFFKITKKKFFQTSFYKNERKKRNILLTETGLPVGGKWTYDTENRKKYPSSKKAPHVDLSANTEHHQEAKEYVLNNFSNNLGELDTYPIYPVDFKSSKLWLKQFFENRLNEFGPYEDAIVKNEHFLNHSVLTPLINTGLLPVNYVLDECISYAEQNNVSINSLEGFIRQIIGWREFIRGIYECKGTEQRNRNYWCFNKNIPKSLYDGTTGIAPIDITIKKILKTGYCHHIERLMILGNFMVLCEFNPDEVYTWFMELFIDSYDWVMVPNVYGMSQFADAGLMSTKPYISGSNYIIKMSDYKKEEWADIWDSLFWRFINKQREFFSKNPRMSLLLKTYDNFSDEKKINYLNIADKFLLELV